MSREEARTLFDEATRLQEAGVLEEAARLLTRVLALQPDNSEAALRLGRCEVRLGRFTRAADAYAAALRVDATHFEALLGRADALRHAGCFILAMEAYDHAERQRPDDAFSLAGRGEALRLLGRPADAIVYFDRALLASHHHWLALHGKATALASLHRWRECVPVWEQILALQPRSAAAAAGRAEAEQALRLVPVDSQEPPPPPMPLPAGGALLAARRHEWGTALSADQRHIEAALAFREALTQVPDRTDWHADLANALTSDGQHEAAVQAWKQAFELDPGRAEIACQLAEAERRAGHPEEALRSYDVALTLDEGFIAALVGRAETLREQRRYSEAIEAYDAVLARSPAHSPAIQGKAASFHQLGRPAESLALWRAALDLDPGSELSARGLEECTRALEAGGAANPSLPVAHAVGGRARSLVDEGRAFLQQSRFTEAAERFGQAAALEPDHAMPWFLLGLAYEGSRQYARAVKAFDEALRRDPLHLDAACRKADALRRKHDYFEALQAYDAVLWTHPEEVRALVGRAETLRLLGKFQDAARWYDRALQVRPDQLPALCGKAAALTALRRFEDARLLWAQALEQDPSAAFARRGLAHCEAALRNERPIADPLPEEPILTPSRAAATPPPTQSRTNEAQSAEPRNQAAKDEFDRGRSFHKDRDYASAVACFQRALTLDPSMADAAFRLGLAYEDDRQFRKAVDAYDRCLTIKPDHVQAATNIGETHRKNEQYKEAIKAYDRALKARGDYLYALAGRGESLRMLGDYEGSLPWFDKALAVGARHAFAIQGKAASLNALRRFKDALPLWEKALEIDPRSQFALDGKAYCESQLKGTKTEEGEETEQESTTPTLDEQGRDLTALARQDKLTRVVGREQEIRSVMKTLVRRQKANPLLLGDPGVGKTAVVEGVAQLLVSDAAPARLRGVRIIELSMGSLVAGTKYRGTFEERLKAIIKEAKAHPGIVLFIDEIHTLVGAGRTEGGSLDAANILKPALARGEINVIGATTMAEYRKHFESDSALERRFQPINIEEPSVEATIELLRKVQHHYAEHHLVVVDPDALSACATLAVRFLPDRRLPDKALDLLDEACAEASLSGAAEVTASMVAQVLAERTGIPVGKLTAEERERISNIEKHLAERVTGQEDAIHQIANTVRLSRAGLRDSRRPRGVFLFVGSSGVGKTELARALADFLFPEGNALIKVDMSEYGEKFTSSRLLGAPPGYAGHGDEGQLTGPLRRRPYAVVLLDEFEKAHGDVQTMFLSLFDEGTVTDSEGRKVDAREAFFIITTNAGTEQAGRGRLGFGGGNPDEQRRIALERARTHFRPELLNRVDEVVWFHPLDEADLHAITRLNLERLRERALGEGVTLTWDESVVHRCALHEPDPAFGARPVLRAIDDLVAEPLGILLLRDHDGHRTYHASVQDDAVVFEKVTPPQATSPHQTETV